MVLEVSATTFEDPFSEEVWRSTYKDHNDNNVDDMIMRVARSAASVENDTQYWTEQFYKLLSQFHATVGGRIYSNIGTEWSGTTLMNCFVSPRASSDIDSLNNIIKNLNDQSNTLKSEGGWGENFSYIRPRGSFIQGIGVESPGAIKYMELFDKSSEIITAGSGKKSTNSKAKGKIRKGAMMGVLDVWHPDIIEFITAKQQPGRLTKFNMSVNCVDEFMLKVVAINELYKDGKTPSVEDLGDLDVWHLRFPDTTFEKYKKEWTGNIKEWESKGYPTVIYNTVSVNWLWNLIMESTYNRNEPGVLFLDRANYFNPLNYAETISATNPCGEQTLAPGGVCNLGSLNIVNFLNANRTDLDYEKVKQYTRILVRLLDNINSISDAPLPEYTYSMRNKRRIGTGVLGWASALLMLKIRFGSPQAAIIRERLMQSIAQEAYKTSIDLAVEKGMFSECQPEKHAQNPFVISLDLPEDYMQKLRTTGIRNSSLLSVQPTGNTSIMANIVSGGLEPVFMPEYIRTVTVSVVPENIKDSTPKWYEGEWKETDLFKFAIEGDEQILRGVADDGTIYKIDKNRGLTKEVLCEDYGVRQLKKTNEWDSTADWAVTTTELAVQDHVSDMKGFARWVDSALSKTINIPNDYPFEDFKQIYLDAYQTGYIKGLTTYRAGTMTTVLSAKEEVTTSQDAEEIIVDDVKMPDSAQAVMKTIRAENRKWYLTIVYVDNPNRPFGMFVQSNAAEKTVVADEAVELLTSLAAKKNIPQHHIDTVLSKCAGDCNSQKVARLISFLLRHGVLIKNIVAVLDKVQTAGLGSFVFHIKKFLASYIRDGETVEDEKCDECGGTVVFREGCKICIQCSCSKCS